MDEISRTATIGNINDENWKMGEISRTATIGNTNDEN